LPVVLLPVAHFCLSLVVHCSLSVVCCSAVHCSLSVACCLRLLFSLLLFQFVVCCLLCLLFSLSIVCCFHCLLFCWPACQHCSCSLSSVCCSAVHCLWLFCLLSVVHVCYLLSTVPCLLPAGLLSVVHICCLLLLLSVVKRVCCLLSVVRLLYVACLLSAACCLLSVVSSVQPSLSPIRCLTVRLSPCLLPVIVCFCL
jgi:hypothetical protein